VGAHIVGQLENRAIPLQTAGGDGMRAAWMALEGEDPELLATLRAYPAKTGTSNTRDAQDEGTLQAVRAASDG
jgi:hypothetical protein